MSINACIYDSRNILAGCITDSVIERFKSEFESLKSKYFGDIVTPILGVMEKSLIQSIDKMSADFLNCLKLLSRKYRDDAPIGFVQEVSRSYHNLVRYCCSQAVYDEVMQETIEQFRSAGMDYVGANSKGFEQNDCIFEYKGKKIAVRMRNKADLYCFWDDGSKVENCATIYDGVDEYVVTSNGSPMDLAEEIVNCVDNDIVETSDEAIVNDIVKAIEGLLGLGD